MPTVRARVLVGPVLTSLLLVVPVDATAQVAAHLDIRSASIAEVSDYDPILILEREVAIRIEVVKAPNCTAARGSLAYGILVDSDKSLKTRARGKELKGLGVDSRIIAMCDPATRTFLSPVGTVAVTEGEEGTSFIEILTTVAMLPSVDFRWIAYAAEDGEFVRLPDKKDHLTWTISELAVR